MQVKDGKGGGARVGSIPLLDEGERGRRGRSSTYYGRLASAHGAETRLESEGRGTWKAALSGEDYGSRRSETKFRQDVWGVC